ncbi:MAG: polysaccharide biosynthesis C-terminal domain-containing protein, partial [Candidatus Methanomethylophilaceae archaeon]|nr:polysaccharide biosynthesis C-terminal domain-containing protein [Candidatus Methanomethylophilaceae archaeon]
GAAKRSMYMQVCGAGLNMVLDPLMINVLGMGVSGAAWATSISFVVSCAVALLWYVRRKGMYVRLNRGYVRPEKRIVRDILSVGLPESMELCVMSVFNVFLNIFVLACGGEGSLAIFSASWRIFYILMVPAQCLGGALVNVASTEMGMGRPDIVRDAFRYAAVVAFVALVAGSVALAVLNGPVAAAFTGSPDLLPFRDEFSGLILCFCLFLPAMSFIYTGSSLMQGIDRATGAMVNTLVRNILLLASFALVTATTASTWDLWIATTVVEIFGGFMMLAHATVSLRRVVGKPMR